MVFLFLNIYDISNSYISLQKFYATCICLDGAYPNILLCVVKTTFCFRFIVEVADFNFGQTYSDMEYKTFRERLRDSIVNAFTRVPSPGSSEVPVWPPSRKYGSMT